MKRIMCAVLSVSAILTGPSRAMAADARTIVGRLTDIRAEGRPIRSDAEGLVLVVRTKRGAEVAVTAGNRTQYVKWVTRQPWQQSRRANASQLGIGKLVAIDVDPDGERLIARLVSIATD